VPVLRSPLGLKEWFGNVRNWLTTSTGADIQQLGEADGTDRSQLILHDGTVQRRWLSETDGKATESLYGKDSATSRPIGVEATNELEVSNYGKAAGTVTAFKVESTGEQDIVDHGKTSGGVVTAKRVDTAGFVRNREFEPYENQAVVAVQTTATVIYTVPASTVAVVEIELSNTDTVANSYDFHIVPSAGAPAVGNRIATSVVLAANSLPDRLGPYHAGAGVTFQALVTTVAGSNGDINAVAVVKEYGTGDSVTL